MQEDVKEKEAALTPERAKELMGTFVHIKANGSRYPQDVYAWVRDYDKASICVIDNDDMIHIFEMSHVVAIEPIEFKESKD